MELIGLLAEKCGWTTAQHNKNIEFLDQVQELYEQSRFKHVSEVQAENCLRRWSWDMLGFEEYCEKLWDFTPKAAGWNPNSFENS